MSRLIWSDSMVRMLAGNDPNKLQLAAVLPKTFAICKREYLRNPDQTGAEFYAFVCKYAGPHSICSIHM